MRLDAIGTNVPAQKLYDNKHDFVSEYGKGILEFVPENKNQSILDLSQGTETLPLFLTL